MNLHHRHAAISRSSGNPNRMDRHTWILATLAVILLALALAYLAQPAAAGVHAQPAQAAPAYESCHQVWAYSSATRLVVTERCDGHYTKRWTYRIHNGNRILINREVWNPYAGRWERRAR